LLGILVLSLLPLLVRLARGYLKKKETVDG
jgi:hypothetical protein